MTVPTVSSGAGITSAWGNQVASDVNGLVPVGTVWMWLTAAPPAGWLLLDGAEISRTGTYAALYAAIGAAGGPGNGTTTWTLPDFRNRMPMGVGPNPSVGLGGTGGSKDAALVSHSHTVNSHSHGGVTGGEAGHWHGAGHDHTSADAGYHFHLAEFIRVKYTTASVAHSHNFGGNTLAEGPAGGPAVGDAAKATIDVLNSGTHSHGVNWNGLNTGAGTNHTHSVGAESPGTNAQGVAATNANLPPYLGINFIVKY